MERTGQSAIIKLLLGLKSGMNEIQRLTKELMKALEYFNARGFTEWKNRLRDALIDIENGQLGVVDDLYHSFAPTCEVEELFITDYDLTGMLDANWLYDELSALNSEVYSALKVLEYEQNLE